ncbi:MAG TPA: DNA-primase RepB domain-containing protein [Candidatus Acidoferrales bacterium]|nr:DNA-primase RepB domain-containing protein [Candidatus Acidoferrales bacterium]
MVDNNEGQPDTSKAFAMLDAFASVGVTIFDLTFTNIKEDARGRQEVRGHDENQSLAVVRQSMPRLMANAPRQQNNIIVRPHNPPGVLVVQLDDLDSAKADRVTPHAFMVIRTSKGKDGAGNYQAWVAVNDAPAGKEAAKDFARRLRKGAGADRTASGATRIAGSLNFKRKYAPAFPLIEITHMNPGKLTGCAALDLAGVVAAREEPRPPLPAYARPVTPSGRPSRKKWPSYSYCVQHAPMSHGEDRPDISRADFTWCRTAIEWGWSKEDTARRLMELSEKAKENGERYAVLTATNAASSVERQPYRDRSTPRPA